MKKFGWVLTCILALGMASRMPAKAQNEMDLTKNWNLRAGFFIPERGASRDAQGDLWFTVGAEREIYNVDRYKGSISIDYYGSSNIYNVPIQANLIGTTHRLRYGAGAGVGFSHDLTRGISGFAYNLLIGYNLTESENPLVFDIRYRALSTGSDLNGWAFTIGGHF